VAKLEKLAKVNETITLNRYDNGWMIEIGGADKKGEWKTAKIMCTTEDEVVGLVKEWNTKELNS
jgi:hypothetical protein